MSFIGHGLGSLVPDSLDPSLVTPDLIPVAVSSDDRSVVSELKGCSSPSIAMPRAGSQYRRFVCLVDARFLASPGLALIVIGTPCPGGDVPPEQLAAECLGGDVKVDEGD
jgi:hypothetical protein